MAKDKQVIEYEAQQIHPLAVQQEQHMKLMELAVQSDGGVEKLEKLMALQERWEQNNARKAFFDAMAAFQEQMPVIEKRGLASFAHNQGGGMTSYTYAKLEDIAAAIKQPLADNNLSYRFEQATEQSSSGPFITVTCIVTHKDGHSESAQMGGYPDTSGKKNAIQQLASTVSYLRRYTLTGALGITVSDEDDDGAAADVLEDVYYPDDQFSANFPGWEKQILSGNKTSDQIVTYLGNKGVRLSDGQKQKINNVGK
jgi:hypothetical protein